MCLVWYAQCYVSCEKVSDSVTLKAVWLNDLRDLDLIVFCFFFNLNYVFMHVGFCPPHTPVSLC